MENSEARQNLLRLSQERGVSLSELSRMIGRNGTYLQQFVRKGSPRKLEETDRRTLARFFSVDEADLGAPEEISSAITGGDPAASWLDIPRLELGVSAGPGAVAAGEQAIGAFRFSRKWLRELGFDPAMLSAICVIGDSMEPTLRDGDEILVDRSPHPPRDGIHVVRLDDTLLVKRVDASRPGQLTLISDNRSYQPISVDPAEAKIVGRVVWKSGRL